MESNMNSSNNNPGAFATTTGLHADNHLRLTTTAQAVDFNVWADLVVTQLDLTLNRLNHSLIYRK